MTKAYEISLEIDRPELRRIDFTQPAQQGMVG
jgi:hypothetical protein